MLKEKLPTEFSKKAMQLECMIHSKLHHPNIVQLLEYTETQFCYELIIEYMDRGNYLEEKVIGVCLSDFSKSNRA